MKKRTVKVVGIKNFKSKEDQEIVILYVEYGEDKTVGKVTGQIFVTENIEEFRKIDIGKDIEVIEHNFKLYTI